MEDFISSLKNQKHVDLRYKRLTDDALLKIISKLKYKNDIEILDLRDNDLTSAGFKALFEESHCWQNNISEVYLGYNKLGGSDLSFLKKDSLKFPNLQVFSINDAGLTDIDLRYIVDFLIKQNLLSKVDISGNALGYASSLTISELIDKCCNLNLLYLSYNNLTGEYLDRLGKSIGKSISLRRLYARCLGLRDQGADLLTKNLSVNECLETLNLGDNEITDKGFSLICKNLRDNKTLKCLNLGRNKLTENSMHSLGQLLHSNDTLVEYNFGKNNIADNGMDILAQESDDISKINIKMFNVRDNNISDKCSSSLSKFFRKTSNIKNINLCDNKLTDIGVSSVCDSLSTKSNLSYFYLSDNKLSSRGMDYLAKCFNKKQVVFPFLINREELFDLSRMSEHDRNGLHLKFSKKDTTVQSFCLNYLEKNGENISSILFDNTQFELNELENLSRYLKTRSDIKFVSFRNCSLGPIEANVLFSGFKEMSLRIIDLKCNHLGKDGAKTLIRAVENHENLELVDLSYNYVGFEFIEEICTYHNLNRLIWKF